MTMKIDETTTATTTITADCYKFVIDNVWSWQGIVKPSHDIAQIKELPNIKCILLWYTPGI